MRRLISIFVIACIAVSAFAQEETPVQPQGGTREASLFSAFSLNYSLLNWKGKTKDLTTEEDMNGFTFGYFMNVPITSHFVTLFGVQYQCGIAIQKMSSFKVTAVEHSIKAPIKFGYSTDFGSDHQFSVFAGPSLLFTFAETNELDYGTYRDQYDFISGKYKVTSKGKTVEGQSDSYKKFNVFDLQLGLGAVYRYKKFGLRLEYDWGVLNRYKNSSKAKTTVGQLTAGVFIAF